MHLNWTITLISCVAASLIVLVGRVIFQVLQLGAGGAAFLAAKWTQHGDVVTIGAFPPRLVFLFDPAAIRQFFTAPIDQIDFHMAVEHFTERVFQVGIVGYSGCCAMCPAGLQSNPKQEGEVSDCNHLVKKYST